MITGRVTSTREAVIPIAVRGFGPTTEAIDAVVDTGFDGFLTLPRRLVSTLRLPFGVEAQAVLGNGREVRVDVFEAVVDWDGEQRRVAIVATAGGALVGMKMLLGYRLTLDVLDGGPVTIARI